MAVDGSKVAVLIPAYNEEMQIAAVLRGVPDFVDHIVVVNDASMDTTADVVSQLARDDARVSLVSLDKNRGVGGALAIAYAWARDHDVDVAVSLDADGQMDPDQMLDLVMPIIEDRVDYTKGNRLVDPRSWKAIPRVRLFGNAVLSLLTKVASGYWGIADSQSGYSAAGRHALDNIDWSAVYPRYGRPNDVLILANVADCRVADVPVRPVYGVGERSSMKILRVIFAIGFLLVRRFWWRLFHKYVLRDFHPLVFFYLLSTLTALITVTLAGRLVWLWSSDGQVPQMTALALAFFAITTLNSLFFAFWMDMETNRHLVVRLHQRAVRFAPGVHPEESPPVALVRSTMDATPADDARDRRTIRGNVEQPGQDGEGDGTFGAEWVTEQDEQRRLTHPETRRYREGEQAQDPRRRIRRPHDEPTIGSDEGRA